LEFSRIDESEQGVLDCTWMTNLLMRKSLEFQNLGFLDFLLKI
jgi:hypothetical protein